MVTHGHRLNFVRKGEEAAFEETACVEVGGEESSHVNSSPMREGGREGGMGATLKQHPHSDRFHFSPWAKKACRNVLGHLSVNTTPPARFVLGLFD